MPARPEEINEHALITLQPGSPINDWHFVIDGQETVIRARGTIATNHGDSILALALSGAGLAMLAAHVVGEHIKSGRLISVLDENVREDVPIYAVYPSNRHLSPKVRAFVDYLVDVYGPRPYWLDYMVDARTPVAAAE